MNSSPYRKTPPRLGVFWIGIALAFYGAGVASAQINGTWTGSSGATWDTTATNWSGVTGTPWDSTNGTTANATFTASSGSASVSGTVYANSITYSSVGGNFSIANGTITLAGTTPTIYNYDSAGALNLSSTLAGSAGLVKSGAGVLTLSGNNSYTGTTTVRGSQLVLDYSGLSNTADPLSTGGGTLDMGTLTLKGKTSGATAETISSLTMGSTSGGAQTLALDSNGGSGIALTISTFNMNTGAGNVNNINLIDLSSSASNSINATALGVSARVLNGILGQDIGSSSMRANLIVRDSTGYGFATLATTTSGTIGRLSSGTALTASNTSSSTNYLLSTPGTLTRTANLDMSTLTLDSSAGAITLAMGSNTLTSSSNGRGILLTGSNDVSITGTGLLTAASMFFHNYSTGNFTLGMSTPASGSSTTWTIGGTGLTVWSGSSTTKASGNDNLYLEGGIFRATAAQDWTSGSGIAIGGIFVSSGAVLEIGADLNGATAGDLSNTIGNTSNVGNIRFWGNSGVSASGVNRTVNFGAGTSLTWGSGSFLTNTGGTGDGNYVFKLSSNRSDSTVTVQNSIALGSLNRTVEVANGSAATDAILSGVLSGSGSLVKSGAGALTLSGNNTYSGSTTISAGTLEIGSTGRLGGGSYSQNITNNGSFIYSGANQQTLSGIVSGSGSLTQNASSTLILSGANTYTGTTTINAGTLQIGTGSTTGSISSSSAITNNGTLVINRSDATTFSNTITGSGGLVKSGAGDLTLSGNNSYAGGTTITGANNLELNANNALGNGALTFNIASGNTGRLRINGTNQTVTSLSILGLGTHVIENQTGSAGSMTFNIADGLTSSSASNFIFRNGGAGTLALVKTGNGTLDFSTLHASTSYAGGLTVNGGVFSYNATAALGSGAISLGGGTLNYTGASGGLVTISNTNISLTAGTTSTLNNANGTVTVSGTIGGTGNLTKSGAGTLTLNGSNTYFGEMLVSAGTLTLSNALALQNSTIDTSGVGVITLSSVTTPTFGGLKGSGNLSSVITSGYSSVTGITLNPGSGVSNTYSGVISDGAAGMTLTKNGSGTQVLSGSNNYTGATTINAGNLTLTGGSAITDTGTVNLANTAGAILHVAQSETIGSLSGGGGSGGNVSIAGGQSLGINVTSVFNGSISGAGALIKNGSGTLTLNGSSTYTGGTTIRSGTISLGANNALGNGSLTFDLPSSSNSFLRLNGTNQTISGLTINTSTSQSVIENNAGGSGVLTINLADGVTSSSTVNTQIRDISSGGSGTLALVKTGNGTLDFSTTGTMNYSGGLTVNGGNLSYTNVTALGNSTAGGAITLGGGTLNYTGSSSVTIANNATLTAGTTSALNNVAGTVTVSGTIGGTGNLTKSGAGNITLSAANTYQGATTVSAGTLSTSAADRISDSSALSVASGATFLLGGSETVGSIAGAGNYSIAGFTLTAGGDNTSTTVSGNITGASGALTKSGSGTLTLSGTNTYSGATTINAGTLTISGGAAIADGGTVTLANTSGVAFNVNSSETIASLQGGGASGGNVTIASAQTLTVGEANTNTFSGSLQGAGNFTKSGLGTLILNGTNTNGGAVSVTGGTVVLSGASALSGSTSLLSAASSTTISLADGVGRTITLSTGNLSLTSATMLFELGSTSDRLTLTSGAATLSGTNTIRLADIGSFAAGTYTLISAASGLNGNWSLDSTGGPTGFTYTLSNSSTTLSLIAAANSNNFYWTGNASANWSGNNFSATDGGASALSGGNLSAASDLIFAATGATNLATTMDSNYTVNSLTIITPSVSIGGSNTLTVNSTASTAIGISAASGNTSISANLAGASAGLTKSGAGTLILTGNNTYAGATAINAGALNVQHASALGATAGGTTVAVGAALQLQGGIAIAAEALSLSGTGVSTDGALRNISGNNSYGGAISLAGTTRINSDSDLLTLSGGIGGAAQALTVGGSGNTAISGVISTTTGTLTKDGLGTLILTANNTYTGATTITAGTLQIGANGTSGALSTSSALTNNGTLVFNRSNAITQGADFANVIAGSGIIIKNGAGNLTLNGTNTFTGQLTIAEGAVIVSTLNNSGAVGVFGNSANSVVLGSSGKSATLSFTGATLTSSKTFTMASGGTGVFDVTNSNVNLTLNGLIDGSGALSKAGAGNLILGGANTYSGGSTLGGSGLVAINVDSVGTAGAPTSSALGTGTVNLAGAQLRAGSTASRTIGNTVTISADTTFATTSGEKSLTFTGPVTLSGGARTLNVAIGSTVTTEKLIFSGAIGDGGNGFGITKTGAGTLALSGANTYTGTTTVSAGTLEVGHVNALQNTTLDTGTSGSQTVNFTVTGANTYNIGGLQGSDALSIGNNTISIGANNASTTYSGSISGTGNLVKTGSGTQTLAGATTFTGTTTVNSGTLQAAAANALANTSNVVINNGGSFLVTADDAIGTNTGIELNGGRMAMSGNFNESVGALTLSANSTLDFSGFVGTLRFGSIASWTTGANLAIWNWSGRTQYGTDYGTYPNSSNLVFTNNATLTNNLANISFYSDSGTTFIGSGFERGFTGSGTEIIAVPEPETYLTGVILLLGLGIYQLRLARQGRGLLHHLSFLRQRTYR